MTGYNPCTVAEAGPIVADALGTDWLREREQVLKILNKCRNEWYNQYSRRKLFFDLHHCICVSCFGEPCGTSKCSTGNMFHGFSLPEGMDSIEAAFESGESLTLRSQWREVHVGLGAHGRHLELVQIDRKYPTERDPQPGTTLKVYAESPDDAGKKMTVKVITEGRAATIVFDLLGDGWAVSGVPVDRIESVVLPAGLAGGVLLQQADGYGLSSYAPWETVPAYRRYKMQQPCGSMAVKIRGPQRYRKIWCDTDLVEIGDPLVLEATAKYFRFSQSSDQKELRTAEWWLAKMNGYLDGVTARARGGSQQDGTMDKGRPVTARTILPGYGACRNGYIR